MKALFVAITLLTTLTASAQTAQQLAPPPPGQATGSAPPGSSGFSGGEGNAEMHHGRHTTRVVVEREVMEERLARLEALLGDAFERSKRGQGRGKLNEAHDELNLLRQMLTQAPDVRDYHPRPVPPPPPAPVYQPIGDGRLQKLMNVMSREPFAEDKMNVLEDAANEHYFTVSQVQQVLPQFQFAKDKLQAVRVLWSRVLDRQNGFQLYGSFQFSKDKAELKKIISG
jgi:hypothetical protein